MKKRILIFLVTLTLALSIFNLTSCARPVQEANTRPKAAIIDQLGSLYPNETFIQDITQNLEKAGFTVTLIKGDQITVDLFQKLPTDGYKLIIFRVHSTAPPDKNLQPNRTFFFTNEPYSKSKYISHQLADRLLPARVDEDSPYYFSVSAEFMKDYCLGQYNRTVIIAMGCISLNSTDMAEAFISCFLQVGIPHFCKTFSPAPVGKINLT